MLTISNANPIQFWLTGQQSFNEKEICSIYPVCFCQTFRCDDIIKTQFIDTDTSNSYKLQLRDSNGDAPIYMVPASLPSLTTWSNVGSGTRNWSSVPTVTFTSLMTFTTSKYWATAFVFKKGFKYTFTFTVTVTGGIFFVNIATLDNSNNQMDIITTISGSDSFTVDFIATQDATKIGVMAESDDAGITESVTINSITVNSTVLIDNIAFTKTTTVAGSAQFDLSFIPDDYSICEEQFEFNIVDQNNNIAAHSDCIKITNDDGNCTELIQYANSSDFAGLDFSSTSPKDYFYLRIPAVFFEEDNPQEQEDLELSDDTIVTLWSKIEAKKTLDIGYMPFYMHLKVQLALMMDDVTIDGVPYRMRDPYQRTPPSSKRSALRRANVILSQKDFIDRNLL